jgi:pyrroloquinoline quinone biosynthesis protein D
MRAIDDTARPRLPTGVRLAHDRSRDRWVLLAPERVLELDEIARSILALCDGERDIGSIGDELSRVYQADRSEIMTDVKEMLGDLAARHFVVL